MKTPQTSGLSLFIHLAIIAVATVLGYIFGRHSREFAYVARVAHSLPPAVVLWYKRVISFLIVASLTTMMVIFTSIAIQTGLREGKQEPQVQYVKSHVAEWSENFEFDLAAWNTLLSKNLFFERTLTENQS